MLVATPLSDPWALRTADAPQKGEPPAAVLGGAVLGGTGSAGTVFAARVPGCVHSDLLTAGAIPDPYLDANEREVAWVGRTDWRYDTVMAAPPTGHERTDLVFDGLDTFAEITLGGRLLGRTANMHRSYRYDVTAASAQGPLPLSVRFASAHNEAERLRDELGARPNALPEPFNHVRKMACSFGWDWGPTLVTAGIWRPVRLESWSRARLAQVRPIVSVAGADGVLTVAVRVERTGTGRALPLELRLDIAGVSADVVLPAGQDECEVQATVPDVELWWPHTLGGQARHEARLTLRDPGDGTDLDGWNRRIGFRTVELDTTADAHGSGFTLKVNGVAVFARGVNWIPDDVLPSRVDAARYRLRLEQAKAANVDLVRVWGGGIYEDRAFYDACDELGLMVWQDFLFACAAYPEEGALPAEVEAEARENVVRLMPHPSLVLWNGNNENLWAFEDWGWKAALDGATWGLGYYLELLPRIVAELDPSRPYWAGSPWSGTADLHPNDPRHGTTHLWEAWNRRDYSDYLDAVPRFVAEFGWQAPANLATVQRSVRDRPLASDSPGMLHHQKAEDGNGKLLRGLAPHFGEPADFDSWHYLTQVNQARAIATGIEHWRANWPLCAGAVVWQLNDCWPVTSWSAIDGDGRLKPLYFELRRLYADRLLAFDRRPGHTALTVVNQGRSAWSAQVEIRRVGADGRTAARTIAPVEVGPHAVARIDLPDELTTGIDPAREFWVADADGLRGLYFPGPDHGFAYPQAGYDVTVAAGPTGSRVTVTAHTLVRDLLLRADTLHPGATTDHGLLTLLPGEQVTFTVQGWHGTDPTEVHRALRCVNQTVSRLT